MLDTSSTATVDNLVAQMSRNADILNGWDAVVNIDENLINRLLLLQFEQAPEEAWKQIRFAFCQTFPAPGGNGKLAVYTRVAITLAQPRASFLGNNQAFIEFRFTADGATGTAMKTVPATFDPDHDADPSDPGLDWADTPCGGSEFVCRAPLAAIAGAPDDDGDVTDFVLDFPAGSFMAPWLDQARDPNELRMRLRNYLASNGVQYTFASLRSSMLDQAPQLNPTAFRIAVLTTNERKNIFQIFIATVSKAPADTTIGVNEPLPDGYSLSAMFNKNIVSAPGPSPTVQTWQFLTANLSFPVNSSLTAGPTFTGGDVLVLGTLDF
jgi:hypothetical protein